MTPRLGNVLSFFILTLVTHSQGLQFSMYRTSDSVYCGHLQCSFEKSSTDNNILSVIDLAVYETTQPNKSKKLASLSVFRPDIITVESDNNIVNVTGNISVSHAELTLGLRNQSYCLTGSFLCEMEFVNVSNKADVIRSTISPLTNGYCNNTEKENVKLRKQVVDLRKDNSKLQNKVGELENGTITLQNKVVEFEIDNITLQNKVVELENAYITLQNKAVELENAYITLQNKVVELETGNIKLQNTSAEFVKENAKLEKQVVELQNEAVKREQDGVNLDKVNVKLQKEVDEITQQNVALNSEVSRLKEMVNTLKDKYQIQTQDVCSKGVPDTKSRKPFLLWGRVAALCDTETDDGGWIIIQRRTKGDVDFYRGWNDYKNGFGTPDTDFWIGNDNIRNLTFQGHYRELRVDMEYQGKQYFATYSDFSVAAESSFYRLSVSGYSGTVRDSLATHNGRSFSTFDKDHDNYSGGNCASRFQGSWWYNACYDSNLNGIWGAQNTSGLAWNGVVNAGSVSVSEMKIRRM